ncbi:MAG: hypothetical protein H6Q22_1531 [Bacteroidetes bacterium]|nr:hypothetical protein [Bacteroidota bacterium]
MHFSQPYANDFVIIKEMESGNKEDISLSNNKENESLFETDVLHGPFENLSAIELLITLENSNKSAIDKFLNEMSYSKRETLYYALSKMDKNLGE